jgi:hypothetical protein
MFIAKNTAPTNYRVPGDSGANKAEKMRTAIEQVFQGHKANFGAETLMSIAFSARS